MNPESANIQYQEFLKLTDCYKQLSQIPKQLQSPEYSKIVDSIRNLMQEKCVHEFIEDYIDIDPDNGKYITYCIYCEKTIKK